MQHDPLQQGAVHGEDPQQDLRPLPAEEVQQVREVHHVSRRRGALELERPSRSNGLICDVPSSPQRQHFGSGRVLRSPELRDHRAEESL